MLEICLKVLRVITAVILALSVLDLFLPNTPEIMATGPYYLAFSVCLFLLFWGTRIWATARTKFQRD
jgi:hypothetical protein